MAVADATSRREVIRYPINHLKGHLQGVAKHPPTLVIEAIKIGMQETVSSGLLQIRHDSIIQKPQVPAATPGSVNEHDPVVMQRHGSIVQTACRKD